MKDEIHEECGDCAGARVLVDEHGQMQGPCDECVPDEGSEEDGGEA